MSTGVRESWERITAWLETRAPRVRARLAASASDADLDIVAQAHGLVLPSDLAESWRCVNGVLDGPGDTASIFPGGYYPASTRGAVRNLEMSETAMVSTGRSREYDSIIVELANEQAGSTTPDVWAHLPSWIVISEGPDRLFVDGRAGPLHGCVMKMYHAGGQLGPIWPNIAAMLAETAEILESIDVSARPNSVEYSQGEWLIPASWWLPGD